MPVPVRFDVPQFRANLLLALMVMTLSGGCGSDDPAGPTGGNGGSTAVYDLYVDAATGSDSNDGAKQTPFKTITHAMTVASAGDSVKVLPGTYDAALGESFPIHITDSVALIGDEPNRGNGASQTVIRGHGPTSSSYTAAIVSGQSSLVAGFMIRADIDTTRRFGVFGDSVDFKLTNNSFDSTYGGVHLQGTGNVVVKGNLFSTTPYGIHSFCRGFATIQDNEFPGGSLPIDIHTMSEGDALVRGNRISAGKQVAIQIQNGSPLIDSNTISGSYDSVYGALLFQFISSSKVRDNHFDIGNGACVSVAGTTTPDLGTATDPGGNVFTGASGIAIQHTGSDTVMAIGNTWHSTTPVCGADIVADSGGVVIWGSDPAERCP
ncbi:MAG: DUF1565 domain-containing protein [Candidatus Zixiibacteriota bacterium]